MDFFSYLPFSCFRTSLCLPGNRVHKIDGSGCYTCARNWLHFHRQTLGDWPKPSLPIQYRCEPGVRHGTHTSESICEVCQWRMEMRQNTAKQIHRQGQVNSNQTGNHATETTAGGNVNVFNYYGSNYTPAYNPTQMSMDPNQFGNAVGTAAGSAASFLSSPSLETLGQDYSDRVSMWVAGNSAIITQESVGGMMMAYGSIPSYLDSQQNTVDLPTRPGPSCDRLYTLESVQWSSTSDRWVLPFPGCLVDMGVFGQNLQFHYLYRSGFMAHVQVNATQFHGGCLIVAIVPECQVFDQQNLSGKNYDNTKFFAPEPEEASSLLNVPSVPELFVYPHQLINLRVNNQATVCWTFNNMTPSSCYTTHNVCRVVIGVVTPLTYGTGGATSVPVTVTIQPVCSQFNGLRAAVKPEGIPTFQIPGSMQFVNTAMNPGFPTYPIWQPTPEFPLPGRIDDFIDVARIPTPMKFSEEHIYLELEAGHTGKIAQFDVFLQAAQFSTSYLYRLSAFYGFYRGSINLEFVYTGPRQTTCKLLIAYTPPGGSQAPATRQEAMLGTHVIWDIGLQSAISFSIPYISSGPYRYAHNRANLFGYDGWITIWYQTTLVNAPGTSNKSHVFGTVSAGTDFSFHELIDSTNSLQKQGFGEEVTQAMENAVQSIMGHNSTTLQAIEPSQQQIVPALPYQPDSAPALTAPESGEAPVRGAENVIAVEPGAVYNIGTRETHVRSIFSRYFPWVRINLKLNSNAFVDVDLSKMSRSDGVLSNSNEGFPAVFCKLIRLATYWRFTLDFVFVPLAETEDVTYQVMFVPPGAENPGGGALTQPSWSGVNPTVIAKTSDPPATLRIPWTSPASYFTSQFDGFKDFAGTQYGVCPSNWLGRLYMRTLQFYSANNKNMDLLIFMRVVDPVCYMPRHIPYIPPQRLGSRRRVERQGLLKTCTDALAESFQETFQEALDRANQTLEARSNSWWKTALGIATKMVSLIVLVVRSRGDPCILAATGALLAVDLIDACPFTWVKQQICELIGMGERQGASDWLKTFNSTMTAAKGVEWILTKLKELIDWIKNELIPKVKGVEKDMTVVERLRDYCVEWRSYLIKPNDFEEESVNELAKQIVYARDVLVREDPKNPALIHIAPTVTQCVRHLANTERRVNEPVGVVIHGAPGTGKSLATQMLGKHLARHFGKTEPYSLPPDPKFFDNYRGQPVVIMDDLGQNPDGEDMKMLCQMISTTDFVTPQADLSDKGRYFVSKVVLASTNCQHLSPPTVVTPKAIKRRFKFDLDIVVSSSFQFDDGTLDVEKALEPCSHDSQNFSGCCPFICGRAVTFKIRTTGEHISLDQLATRIKEVEASKRQVSAKIDVFLQGPTLKRKCKVHNTKKLTPEMIDLIVNDPAPGKPMAVYAKSLGYEIPEELTDGIIVEAVKKPVNKWKNAMLLLTALATILTTVYMVWRMIPKSEEGPYSGPMEKKLVKPIPRRAVETQGNLNPDMEFALSLIRHNIFPIETGTGHYTALGIYGNVVVLPKHAAVGPYTHEGKELEVEDEWEIVKSTVPTEIVCMKFKNLQPFKDLRKFLTNQFVPVDDALLVMNSGKFPRSFMNLGKVYMYGNLNLEGDLTANVVYYHAKTQRGCCGGVVLKAGKIVGMHIAGDGVNGYAAWLKASYFAECEGEMKNVRDAPKPVNVNRRTRFQPSAWHHLLDQDALLRKGPAVLSQKDPRCRVDFEANLFQKYKGNVEVGCPELETAVAHYAAQLAPLMPPNVSEELTLDEACDGYGRLEGLDLDTSAGYPYCTMGLTKRKLMENDRSLLIKGLDLHGYNLPLVTALKDELRPLEKVYNGNTRLIEAASINDTIRMKMKCGRLFEAIVSNPGVATGIAVGCNPDVDWTRFAAEMHPYVLSFDYKNFDASLSPGWFKALIQVLRRLGLNVDELIVNICNSTHIYGSKMYDVEGGMPSGTSGTSIFNSMINNLIIKTIALLAYKGIDLDQLKILTYGDDCLVSYPYPLDGEQFAKFGKYLGLTITPADKSDKFRPAGPITEHTFLKRGFKPDDKYQFLYHPTFDIEECYQSLAWTRNPAATAEHVQSLVRLIWHNGEDTYRTFVKFVKSVPIGNAIYIPPYEVLQSEWYDSF
uniref:Genome polyprotein n=1 Tax=Sapelovirus sp. TaxID=2809836 RepID=A0AA48X994_9PICO|nr:polyprotein [Sapelovirus sp.]